MINMQGEKQRPPVGTTGLTESAIKGLRHDIPAVTTLTSSYARRKLLKAARSYLITGEKQLAANCVDEYLNGFDPEVLLRSFCSVYESSRIYVETGHVDKVREFAHTYQNKLHFKQAAQLRILLGEDDVARFFATGYEMLGRFDKAAKIYIALGDKRDVERCALECEDLGKHYSAAKIHAALVDFDKVRSLGKRAKFEHQQKTSSRIALLIKNANKRV